MGVSLFLHFPLALACLLLLCMQRIPHSAPPLPSQRQFKFLSFNIAEIFFFGGLCCKILPIIGTAQLTAHFSKKVKERHSAQCSTYSAQDAICRNFLACEKCDCCTFCQIVYVPQYRKRLRRQKQNKTGHTENRSVVLPP